MNPIVHAEIGWLLAQALDKRRDRVVVTLAAVAPDLDGFGILVSEQLYADWHHKLGHGVLAAVVVPAVALAVTRSPKAALLAFCAFHSHILGDLVGSGPGWPLWYLWPFSALEWLPSWQWDLASWQNSAIGLAVTLTCLACALFVWRTPVELFSVRADEKVVQTIRARFPRFARPRR